MSCDVLLFGGTFDPIHVGHLIVARAAAERLAVDKIVLIPAAVPPHKQDRAVSDPADRLEMLRRAIDGEDGFEVDDQELRRDGPSYTIDTVRAYRRDVGEAAKLYWLIGSDSTAELGTWREIGALAALCTFVTVARPGFEAGDLAALSGRLPAEQIERIARHVIQTPRIEVSSTDVRRRVAAGRSIRYLVPDAVASYVAAGGLYRGGGGGG